MSTLFEWLAADCRYPPEIERGNCVWCVGRRRKRIAELDAVGRLSQSELTLLALSADSCRRQRHIQMATYWLKEAAL